MEKRISEKCIHCGQCTRNCLFLEKYGLDLSGFEDRPDLAYRCFLCGVCRRVCPVDIDGRAIGMKGRKQQVADAGGRIPTRDYNIMLAEKRNYKFANYRHARAEQKAVLFPGCNFPSFFPETTKALVSAFGEHGIGTVFDCCGKPVQELGLEEDAQRILRRINEKMKENGVTEIITCCPNCYWFLGDKLDMKVVSIYTKMKELGIGRKITRPRFPMFDPCPDRTSLAFQRDVPYFLDGEIDHEAFRNVQCCGLGGSAGQLEPDLVREMARRIDEEGETLYTCCASCISNFRRLGLLRTEHILPLIMGVTDRYPKGAGSVMNRMKFRMY